MVSKYDEKDDKFVETVSELLWQRTRMNMNDDIPSSWGEGTYPQTSITNDDIRHFTNRHSVRSSVINKLATQFQSKGFEVNKKDGELTVKVPEARARKKTDFSSVRELELANQQRMKEYHSSRSQYDSEEEFQSDNPDANPYD